MTPAERKHRADRLADLIEALAFQGEPVPERVVRRYDALETDHRRALAVLALAEPATEHDPRWRWLV